MSKTKKKGGGGGEEKLVSARYKPTSRSESG